MRDEKYTKPSILFINIIRSFSNKQFTGTRRLDRAICICENLISAPNSQCGTGRRCNITCESDYLNCFILDNNAYIVLSDEIEYTGRFIGDIRADIMYHLIEDGVFEDTRMFDYQAICQKEPPKKRKRNAAGSPAMRFRKVSPIIPNEITSIVKCASLIIKLTP